MVNVAGYQTALQSLKSSVTRKLVQIGVVFFLLLVFYQSCTTRIGPNQFGVEQRRFGLKTGIIKRTYTPGLYFVGFEASYEHEEARAKARGQTEKVDIYFKERDETLGEATHRTIQAINVQTSDGYSVTADVTLLYSIEDPVKVAEAFGWGRGYVDNFVLNTFRNTVLVTLGKMNAESFYNTESRIKHLGEAEVLLKKQFSERGFRVDELLLRNFKYVDNYERALKDKKVAVQLTEKNRKESLVNEEQATLQQIESKGNAAITIAESEVSAKIAKIRSEAELYSSRAKARADTQVNVAMAEAKRLKADALTNAGGRYVVALETAKMFDNIDGAVMTPEQYVAFVRAAWALIGVSGSRTEEGARR
jgi:regulator of protease activity HflC (stomatin/prohibitin superfamily)